MIINKHPLSFDINLETIGSVRIAGWAFPPYNHDLPPAVWLLAIPGVTYTAASYYDRQVPGHAPHAYSMARHVAAQGIGSILIDNLGTGESYYAESDKLTPAIFAEVYHKVAQNLSTLGSVSMSSRHHFARSHQPMEAFPSPSPFSKRQRTAHFLNQTVTRCSMTLRPGAEPKRFKPTNDGVPPILSRPLSSACKSMP